MSSAQTIEKVCIVKFTDECQDLSYYGEYSLRRKLPTSIDRKARGDWKPGEFQYFTPAMTGEETGNPQSPENDYQRMEAYERGDWLMVGIRAEARTVVNGIALTISSGGLHDIESDNEQSYFEETAREELSELKKQLETLGFDRADIEAACKNPEWVSK